MVAVNSKACNAVAKRCDTQMLGSERAPVCVLAVNYKAFGGGGGAGGGGGVAAAAVNYKACDPVLSVANGFSCTQSIREAKRRRAGAPFPLSFRRAARARIMQNGSIPAASRFWLASTRHEEESARQLEHDKVLPAFSVNGFSCKQSNSIFPSRVFHTAQEAPS